MINSWFQCNFTSNQWEPLVDNFLLHLNKSILIKRRWNHQVNFRFWRKVFHIFNHFNIVFVIFPSVPLIDFGVICAKHHNDDVCFWVQSILISLFIPIWKVACFHHGSATNSKINHFKLGVVFQHIHKLWRIWFCFGVWRACSLCNWVTHCNNSRDSFFFRLQSWESCVQ